eukprot:TRINITY_DN830_c0_g2_i1.p1 TRINITY_DN830_c0_g2~~TRINITY_DN830_c0_g2_i1.p1  ORF type:complete len:104 (+),score=1.54 TRINITY_DN830_c0_g2_i1:1270-1581(+)
MLFKKKALLEESRLSLTLRAKAPPHFFFLLFGGILNITPPSLVILRSRYDEYRDINNTFRKCRPRELARRRRCCFFRSKMQTQNKNGYLMCLRQVKGSGFGYT